MDALMKAAPEKSAAAAMAAPTDAQKASIEEMEGEAFELAMMSSFGGGHGGLDRLGISAAIWCRLVKDFGRLFSVVAGQPERIDEHRSKDSSRRYRTRQETHELLATAKPDPLSILRCSSVGPA